MNHNPDIAVLKPVFENKQDVLERRRAGILLHLSSLPGRPDNGDLGHDAYRFIEFLADTGISVWQMLPIGPTHEDASPYQCLSVHAGNPAFISLDWLVDKHWLEIDMCRKQRENKTQRHDCLLKAFDMFQQWSDPETCHQFETFQQKNSEWLDDFALYCTIRQISNNRPWYEWSPELRHGDHDALNNIRAEYKEKILQYKFEQYVFFRQWHELKDYANRRGVWLFGDMPIFVAHDSAEVWAHREYFAVHPDGELETQAGVPPDYYSKTGQRWGNPHYRWDHMKADGFKWWLQRMRTQLELFDLVRVDHFRGFEAYWEIPAGDTTAENGRWVKAPGDRLLETLHLAFDSLPLVAEDLGVITPEVVQLRQRFNLPGMKILQFAFSGESSNPYLPHNHEDLSVVYTGTHDNDTTLAWYASLSDESKAYINEYFGDTNDEDMSWALIRSALGSVSRLAILPMQDILSLGQGHRMNKPGTIEGNWSWRFQWQQVTPEIRQRLYHMLDLYGRNIMPESD